MTRRKALSLAVALSVMSALLPVGAVAAPIVFSDGTFDPADWEETHLLIGNGGTVTTLQLGTGGNPDEYRMVILQVNGADAAGSSAVWAFYRRLGADYDPQTQGAIESLDYSEDSVLIVPPPF